MKKEISFYTLWVDEEHGIVVIKSQTYSSSTYEHYLVYDFDRMNVTSATTHIDKSGKYVTRYGKGKYGFMVNMTQFKYAFALAPDNIREERDIDACTIIDALIQMFNRTFGHLFRFDFNAMKTKKSYYTLRLYLILMWYLTQYPHITYVVNDMPLLRQRLIRMSYTNCFSRIGNWSPEKVFKLHQLLPHEMLGLSKSTYKRLCQRIHHFCEPIYVINIAKSMSTEELNALLDIPNIKSHHLAQIDGIICSEVDGIKWVRKLIWSKHHSLHKQKMIELVCKNMRTLVDHCVVNNLYFSDLPTSAVALHEIIRRHAEDARQHELARSIESHNKAQERLDNTSAKYKKITDMVIGDYEFVLLDSVKAFMDEGDIMNNCVSMYMHYEDCLIISMRREQQPVVNIEYVLNTQTIRQQFAKSNRKTTVEQNKVISKWLKTVNKSLKGERHA